jgi:hypothetical protein
MHHPRRSLSDAARAGRRRAAALLAATAIAALLAGMVPGAALAAPPTHDPLVYPPSIDLPAGVACPFDVRLDILVNDEVSATFTARDGLVRLHATGRLVVRVVNVTDGANVTLNVSGPSLLVPDEDGSATSTFYGNGLIWTSGTMTELSGTAVIVFASDGTPGALMDIRGRTRDICAAIG